MQRNHPRRRGSGNALLSGVLMVALLTTSPWLSVATAQQQPMRNVAIVIWNGAEILDWAGPTEVFVAATYQGAVGDHRPFQVYTVSKTREPIVSQGFVDVIPDYGIEDAPKPDIVVFPGGGAQSVIQDADFLAWATNTAREAEIALSVCTGAFILGKAGLLDDKDVTTWYGATSGLATQFPAARVHEGRRFIDNGQVITTAGVSAGIDGALHVVARLLGRDVAERTAQYMEYLWAPPAYLTKGYSWLNPNADSYGRELQKAAALVRARQFEDAIGVYRRLLSDEAPLPTTWYSLARVYYQAGEYDASAKAFEEAAADPQQRSRAFYNAACSAARDQNLDHAFEYLEHAIEAGFRDQNLLESDEDLAALRQDARFEDVQQQITARSERVSR